MTPPSITASAPGSIMISGEHAVVYGKPAIVAAIEGRIYVTISPRTDNKISIDSALGDYESDAHPLTPQPKLRFVLAAISRFPERQGMHLDIESHIDATLGLGTSAAVTIATLGGLCAFYQRKIDNYALHQTALDIVQSIQQRGSGADLAASLWGGMIAYRRAAQTSVTPLPAPLERMALANCGYKTPTAEVLAMIAEKMTQSPARYAAIYREMGEVTTCSIAYAQKKQWSDFYQSLEDYQVLMTDLGVCDEKLQAMLDAAHRYPDTRASKISGSGLGDCIVTFATTLPPEHTAAPLATQGLIIDAAR